MGNAESGLLARKLSQELPPLYQTQGMFTDHKDREQFISTPARPISKQKSFLIARSRALNKDVEEGNATGLTPCKTLGAIIAVVTANGQIDLSDHDFKLLYSRREGKDDRFVARIVAVKDNVITAKIEPELDGQDHEEAFMAFRKDVEIKLDRLLEAVPDIAGDVGQASTSNVVAAQAPPAYSPSVGVDGYENRKQ